MLLELQMLQSNVSADFYESFSVWKVKVSLYRMK